MNNFPQTGGMGVGGGIGGGNGGMFDMIKTQMMSMMMIQSMQPNNNGNKNGNGNGNGTANTIWGIIWLMILEKVMAFLPSIIKYIETQISHYVKKKADLITTTIVNKKDPKKEITATITYHIQLTTNNENVIGMAILDFITNHPNTKNTLFINNNYMLNTQKPIVIDEYLEIYVMLKSETIEKTPQSEGGSGTPPPPQIIEVMTYKITMEELREYINKLVRDYNLKIQNKLGNKLFFFNEIPIQAMTNTHIDNNKQTKITKDYARLPPNIMFSMKPFHTNRKFSNVFGSESDLIQKRVNFFKNNRKWYDEKGIPYTLGLLFSGQAGSGKTSNIKTIANETKRHIININLHGDLTKSQIENLFFNENINVVGNGRTEQYNIPIDKRLYVLEDIDCQSDIVFERKHKEVGDPHQKEEEDCNKLTLSFLLNLLDGVLETPGRILIMTSNYPEKLDHALIRPGRIDLICKFRKCNNETVMIFYEKFYDIVLSEQERAIIMGFSEYQWSPAEVIKILFENFNAYGDALLQMIELNRYYIADEDDDDININNHFGGDGGVDGGGITTIDVTNNVVIVDTDEKMPPTQPKKKNIRIPYLKDDNPTFSENNGLLNTFYKNEKAGGGGEVPRGIEITFPNGYEITPTPIEKFVIKSFEPSSNNKKELPEIFPENSFNSYLQLRDKNKDTAIQNNTSSNFQPISTDTNYKPF